MWYCYWTGTGPEQACLRPAYSVWVLDLLQQRFHNRSPGDFESMFIKAGDSKTKEGPRIEEETGERLGGPALAL